MYNRAILVGRFVADPELRTTLNGKSVCRFRLAVNRPFKDENGESKADFITCVCWGKSGESISTYFAKGKMIGIEGALQSGEFTDKEGIKRYTVEVNVERWFFTESKGD